MNSPNRHMQYRRSVYRRRKIKTIIVTVCCAVVIFALFFVIIGNVLGKKVDERNNTDTPNTPTPNEDTHAVVKDVYACHVPLSQDGSTLATRLSGAAGRGYADVCFEMDTSGGQLLYISNTAMSLGKQTNTTDLRTLENIVGLMHNNSLYSIGIMRVPDLKNDNDLIRAAAQGYYASLAAEAFRAGVDDVLIYVDEVPLERYSELVGLAEEIQRLSPDGNIGLSLPSTVLQSADNASLIDSLWNAFDYLAADVSVSSAEQPDEVARIEGELGGILYYLLRYNLRVLLPSVSDTAVAEQIINAAKSCGAKSIQFMP